jgi:hypothetical protein
VLVIDQTLDLVESSVAYTSTQQHPADLTEISNDSTIFSDHGMPPGFRCQFGKISACNGQVWPESVGIVIGMRNDHCCGTNRRNEQRQ